MMHITLQTITAVLRYGLLHSANAVILKVERSMGRITHAGFHHDVCIPAY
jgi:hypothetical protein